MAKEKRLKVNRALENMHNDVVSHFSDGYIRLNDASSGTLFDWQDVKQAVMRSRRAAHTDPMIMRGQEARVGYVHGRPFQVVGNDPGGLINSMLRDPDGNVWDLSGRKKAANGYRTDGHFAVRGYENEDGTITWINQDVLEMRPDLYIRNPIDKNRVWVYARETIGLDGHIQIEYFNDFRFIPSQSLSVKIKSIIDSNQEKSVYRDSVVGAVWLFNGGWPAIDSAVSYSQSIAVMLQYSLEHYKIIASIAAHFKVAVDAVADVQSALEKHMDSVNEEIRSSVTALQGTVEPITLTGSTLRMEDIEPFERRVGMVFGVRRQVFMYPDNGSLNTGSDKLRDTIISAKEEQSVWVGIYQSLLDYQIYRWSKNSSLPANIREKDVTNSHVNQYFGIKGITYTTYVVDDNAFKIVYPEIDDKDAAGFVSAIIDAYTLKGNIPRLGTPADYWREVSRVLGLGDQSDVITELEGMEWVDFGFGKEYAQLKTVKRAFNTMEEQINDLHDRIK